MPFSYLPALDAGALRQGEILGELWTHRALTVGHTDAPEIRSFRHALAVVLTADCDLLQDFNVRFAEQEQPADPVPKDQNEDHPAIVPFTILCELFMDQQVRGRGGLNRDLWRRVVQNQDERYHAVPMPGTPDGGDQTRAILDFKKALAVPTEAIYSGILAREVRRVALIPPVYIHDLIHRFYGFLSRVGVD